MFPPPPFGSASAAPYRARMSAIALFTPTRPGFHESPTDAEREALAAHFSYLRTLVAEGRIVAAGPCEDGSLGIAIFPTDDADAATAAMAADPAVLAGVFRCEVRPWRMSLFGTGTGRDWTGFTQRIVIDASPDAVWPLVSTGDGLVRWFVRRTEVTDGDGAPVAGAAPLPAGGRVSLVWATACDPSQTTEPGEAIEVDGIDACDAATHRVRIGWYEDAGWVEVRLSARADGGCVVELEQRMDAVLPHARLEGPYIGCREGWAFYLANLKAVVEQGIDLRSARPDVAGQLNA